MDNDIRIVSIGAGNMATHLIPALKDKGCSIVQIFSRDKKNAIKLSLKVGGEAIDDLAAIVDSADLYLIMVHDDAIRDVVDALPQLSKSQFLAHTSGATQTNFLKKKAINYGSFYPLQTLKKKIEAEMEKVPFLIFGNNAKTTRQFRMVARQVTNKVVEANDKERLLYHLSAVILNNFSNHLACLTNQLLEFNSLDTSILEPIKQTTYNRLIKAKACETQTGPAIRNDNKVEQSHLELLKDNPDLMDIYKSMSKSIKAVHGLEKEEANNTDKDLT